MTAALAPFDFQGQTVRVVTDVHGEPWFVARDVAAVLGIANGSDAIGRVADDEKGVATTDTLGGAQQVATVNEPGLYRLIFTSRKAEAESFRRWVIHEVLPAIRKTGGYGLQVNPAEITRADMARMILAAEEELAVVSAALKSAEPAIAYHDRFIANDDACTVKTWAAQFGLTQPQAFDLLVEKRVIYKHPIGQRWSAKAGRVVDEREYRARAGRQSFAWFDLRPQHNAPRHHNGQVRQTLYVRQGYALELAKLVGLGGLNAIEGAA